jgi:hypothetical protein
LVTPSPLTTLRTYLFSKHLQAKIVTNTDIGPSLPLTTLRTYLDVAPSLAEAEHAVGGVGVAAVVGGAWRAPRVALGERHVAHGDPRGFLAPAVVRVAVEGEVQQRVLLARFWDVCGCEA